jgi:hypothetical protein
MEKDKPISICGGGDELELQAQAYDGNPDYNGDDIPYGTGSTPGMDLPAEPPTEETMDDEAIHRLPLLQGSGTSPEFGLSFTLMFFSLREPSVPTIKSLSSPDVDHTFFLCNQVNCQESKVLSIVSLAILPRGDVYVPFPPGSGKNASSYYSCPGCILEHDPIYPTPGFDPKTQKQVLCTI